MAYEPTVWNCDDELSAEKLNKLEEGVAQIMSDYVPTQWSCDDVITAEKLNKLEQAVAEASEGGSCDFSTATVTVINDSSDGVTMIGAFFDEGSVYGQELSAPGTQEMSLIVYENASSELFFELGTTTITTITGAATKRGNAYVDVTGDCTITIS